MTFKSSGRNFKQNAIKKGLLSASKCKFEEDKESALFTRLKCTGSVTSNPFDIAVQLTAQFDQETSSTKFSLSFIMV